jgi:hypothetical protein
LKLASSASTGGPWPCPLLDGLGAQIARWIIEIHKSFAFAELVIGFEQKGLPNTGTTIPGTLLGYTEENSDSEFTKQDVQYLLEHAKRATVNFSGYTSESRQFKFIGTLLHWVILIQDEESFKLLLRNGAEVDAAFKEYGRGKSIDGTALYLALQGKSRLMQNELLDRDTNPNAPVIMR